MITRFTTIVVTVITLSFVLLGIIFTVFEYERFARQVNEFKSEITCRQRHLLQLEVDRTIEYLENQQHQIYDIVRKRLKTRIYRAQAILDNLRSTYTGSFHEKQLQKLFLTVLQPQSFVDNGYYFISDFNGVSLLNPNRPELEGHSLLTQTDCRGLNLAKEFISIAKNNGEGFQRYFFRKPGSPKDKEFAKISFIKRLEPYDMYIGSGVYLDDLDSEIQNNIRDYLKSYRFGYNDSGYIFIIKINDLNGGERFGTMFVNANRPDLEGKYLSDNVTDAKGKFFRKEFLKGLREKGECFVEYWYKKFDHPAPELKLTFFKHYTSAGLIVAAGSYMPEYDVLIAKRREQLISKLQSNLSPLLISLAIITLFMVLLARWWTRKTGNEFDRFRENFNQAAIQGKNIKESDFSFLEMRVLARDTNLMLAERDNLDVKLKEREELFRTVTEMSSLGIFIYQGDIIVYANPATSLISGFDNEELIGMCWWDLVHPEMRELIRERGYQRQAENSNLLQSYQFKIICKDQTEKWLLSSSVRISYQGEPAALGNVIDISEKIITEKALEEEQAKRRRELEKIAKMEAVGLLAGGIAHDFNNLLAAIYGNISLAVLRFERSNPDLVKVKKNLVAAENSLDRARELTSKLLTFSQGGEPVKELVDISSIIRETAEFFLSGSNVKLEIELPSDLKTLEVDKGQFAQIINNLVVNANQAMPDGGTLIIKAENVVTADLGEAVNITVQDDGIGIQKEHLDKIFEPYFTTKTEGSGLGLASTYSIVTRHGGRMTVYSEISIGTCFKVTLPASGKQLDERTANMDIVKGSGKIMVMDDENVVRDVCVEFLTDLGYEVSGVVDGQEMLKVYQNAFLQGKPFDLVIMDLTIPGGMGGKEAIAALLEIDPQAKAIVCSGYSQDPVMSRYREYGFKGTCAKPFEFVVLSQVVKAAI